MLERNKNKLRMKTRRIIIKDYSRKRTGLGR